MSSVRIRPLRPRAGDGIGIRASFRNWILRVRVSPSPPRSRGEYWLKSPRTVNPESARQGDGSIPSVPTRFERIMIPILWQHDWTKPIGKFEDGIVTFNEPWDKETVLACFNGFIVEKWEGGKIKKIKIPEFSLGV